MKSCGDCTVELFISLDEFADVTVRDAADKSLTSHVPNMSAVRDLNVSPPIRRAVFVKTRGSPPPPVALRSAPLRVRYSVFLV
ncbi:MAG: hypothetical protein ACSHX9_05625 [Luteolibacter sp.]